MTSLISGRRTVRRLAIALLAGAVAAAISGALPQQHLVQGWVIDMSAAVRAVVLGARPLASERVAVVTLGDRSLESDELASLPRALFSPVWAALSEKALGAGARSVAFDFIFDFDAGRLGIDGTTPLKDYDRDFLRQLHVEGRQGRIILGRSGLLLPARRFQQVAGAAQLGLVEAPLGPGNVVRRVRSVLTGADGTELPTLAALSLRSVGVVPPELVYLVPPGPVDTIPNVELIDVLRCADPARLAQVFDGRVVFVGSSLAGEDRLKGADHLIPDLMPAGEPTPSASGLAGDPCLLPAARHRGEIGHAVPGVFLHAAAADAVLSGWAPTMLGEPLRLLLTGATAAFAAAFALFGHLSWAIPRMILLTLGVFAGGVLMLELGILLPSADPVLAAPAAFAIGWAARISLLDRQARAIRREFGKYLSPALIERMIDQRSLPELGGESREVTVMFADLSGFTRLSTEVPEKQLMQVLNEYLDRCATIVQRSGGYVDKFIGDAVMAIWNAPADLPHHARDAVFAGLEITRAVDEIHAANVAAGQPGLRIKVAINTGMAIVGNIGSRDRMNYTVVGSAVNAAARMEDLPRIFATPVILGEATARAVADDFVLLPVAAVRLEGIGETMEVYAPLVPMAAASVTLRALLEEYARARRLADAERTRQALEIWDRLSRLDWPGAGPSGAMLRRTAEKQEGEGVAPLRLRTDGLAS